jgi:hypothetical protein
MHVATDKTAWHWMFELQQKEIHSWKLDFDKLFSFSRGEKEVRKVALFDSKPPNNDSLCLLLKTGFEVITYDTNVVITEEKIDTDIVEK